MTISAHTSLALYMLKNRYVFACIATGALLLVGGALWSAVGAPLFERVQASMLLGTCEQIGHSERQIDCIFNIIHENLREHGLESALGIFQDAYDSFYSFSSTGCHRHAHRVGDMVYYELYLQQDGFNSVFFPQTATACGYGLFHGFIEHLIQDNPSPAFVTETCNYLHDVYGDSMGAIRLTCYHGSGHGFMLHTAERIEREAWGDLSRFTSDSLEKCMQLSEATEYEQEECRQGVFNVIVDWMSDEEYGFSYDYENPFAVCDSLQEQYWHACYYEMAQKTDRVSGEDPRVLARIVEGAPNQELADTAFSVGIAGIVQQVIADEGEYERILHDCSDLSDAQYRLCLQSVIHGLFEHGPPAQEYQEPLALCADNGFVGERDLSAFCYKNIAQRLTRFYEPAQRTSICREFPAEFQDACTEKMSAGRER